MSIRNDANTVTKFRHSVPALIVAALALLASPRTFGSSKYGPAGGSGSGTVTSVTSTGGTVTVTNASGPAVNLEVGPTVTSATWTVGNTRWYAVDAAGGNDSNVGYSDTSSADAWTKRKATITALAAIIPRNGAGRTIAVIVGGGGQTYADDLGLLFNGTTAYTLFGVRATGTLSSAGATAGAGDVADLIGSGYVTATGMNAAGYNPTGAPTTTAVQLLKVGGGAPGFSAEPAIPVGARMRFDSATTTSALRNICRTATRLSGTDTLYPSTPWPATPTSSDVMYIEMPGTTVTLASAWHGNLVTRIAGFSFSGAVILGGVSGTNPTWAVSNSFFGAALTIRNTAVILTPSMIFPGIATTSIGDSRVTGAYTARVSDSSLFATVIVGLATFQNPQAIAMNAGFFAGGIQVEGGGIGNGEINAAAISTLGAITPGGGIEAPTRVLRSGSSAITLIGAKVQLGQLTFPAGSARALSIQGTCHIVNMSTVFSTAGSLKNEGANLTDIGVEFNSSGGNISSGSIFRQGVSNASNVVGANGAIRMVGGHILTWAQINATGIVDRNGNRIIGPEPPSWAMKSSGFLLGAAGATTSTLADTGSTAGGANMAGVEYVTSLRIVDRLYVRAISNTFATSVVATVYKNGVATALTTTITAGSTATFSDTTAAHAVLFSDGDRISVVLSNAGDNGKTIVVTAWVEGPS